MEELARKVKELLEAVDPSVTVVEATTSSALPSVECTQSLDSNADKSSLEDLQRQLAMKLQLRTIMMAHPNDIENGDQVDALNLEIAELERRIGEVES